jgi:hypothetical protein
MDCKRCDELLDAYRLSLSLFRESVLNFPPAAGEDSRTASKQADRLRVKCKEDSDALRRTCVRTTGRVMQNLSTMVDKPQNEAEAA